MNATRILAFAAGLSLVLLGTATGQAAPPKGATGECADGTYTTAKTKDKGCAKHGGVKIWFADAGAPTSPPSAPSSTTPKSSTHVSTPAQATVSGKRPNGATGQCADGSYTTAKTKDKGCAKHGGVKIWFADAGVPAAPDSVSRSSASNVPTHAPTPATAPVSGARPKNATGQCADGSYTTAKTEDRGCAKHGGVKTWFGTTAAAAATPTKTATPAPARSPESAPASAPAPSVPGQVWVNTATKVYHCAGTKYYGNTKKGKYMSEAEAKAAGYHADHGKACN